MALDRGSQQLHEELQKTSSEDEMLAVEETQRFLAQQAEQAQNFTVYALNQGTRVTMSI